MKRNEQYFWDLLEEVKDPEIPVLSVIDLGVVRDVKIHEGIVEIIITPTYSGCPAMDFIEVNIKSLLQEAVEEEIKVTTVLHPAWTTDWISDSGKEKLRAYGIAPPVGKSPDKTLLFAEDVKVPCPRCNADDTTMVSQFGSTACKSLYKCNSCKEPFDYFKCH
jgi:ring-1,2-phenylacetyl-CoA epoxidase subunit PaaD